VEESKGKMKVVGKVSMILGMEEMKTESNIQRNLPIRLKVNGLIIEATLSVYMLHFPLFSLFLITFKVMLRK
jgi:hypothetical protein